MDLSSTPRLSEQLREKIEENIVTGTFCPGVRLDEVDLAETYGVSRTPIREALIQLEAAGFINKRLRKGWEVASIPASRLCEMFDVMAELEAMCGRLAARRATEAETRQIRSAHLACLKAKEASDPAEYYRLNEAFHLAIYEASHNSFLIEQASTLHRRLRPYRRLQLRVRNRMHTSFDEHEGIVKAIENGMGDLACDMLRAHVVVQGERFTDLVSSLESMTSSRMAVEA
ncbi:Transcriptional regulator GntR family [Paramagnetospirillum magnetotacticum MS-1]|uniref:Transcriptional regulator GntR family n=1 Tax=Paramagnetospirillum magnetotacticum MS-1 TaxID=272627 RepID=A0A0C2UV53_PARME|nr:GntR family transcriptional regulator [Paramagnetospirillum magnetotacticum]KIL96706.1 Transcriptional regulator GntR family [Paramagnetospirillum magnetotacticum MS-1]